MGIFVEQNLNQKDGAVLVGDIKMIKLIGGEMILQLGSTTILST
jgi:hypothetical protein